MSQHNAEQVETWDFLCGTQSDGFWESDNWVIDIIDTSNFIVFFGAYLIREIFRFFIGVEIKKSKPYKFKSFVYKPGGPGGPSEGN